jgi:hypothetical protein
MFNEVRRNSSSLPAGCEVLASTSMRRAVAPL